jgi:hypothetical protein
MHIAIIITKEKKAPFLIAQKPRKKEAEKRMKKHLSRSRVSTKRTTTSM